VATDTRFVTFADVLGFKDLVEHNPHDELLTIYREVLRVAVDFGVGGGIDHDPSLAVVNMRLISDSVILWTDSDQAVDFEAMIRAVTNLLGAGMHYGLPPCGLRRHGGTSTRGPTSIRIRGSKSKRLLVRLSWMPTSTSRDSTGRAA
jgi:hypothetical protein